MTTASREERAPAMYQSLSLRETLRELRDQDQIQMEIIQYISILYSLLDSSDETYGRF